jgi:3-isopropylmalate dehydrogenase
MLPVSSLIAQSFHMSSLISPSHTIAILPGDGIGPEVVEQGLRVLRAIEEKFDYCFTLIEAAIGGAGVDLAGVPLPPDTLALAKDADAVFLGAVGGPQYDTLDPAIRPEQGLLQIRKALGLYANLRPVTLFEGLEHASPLKPECLAGTDLLVVRELTGGLYFGQPKGRSGFGLDEVATDTLVYSRREIERIARLAFEQAMIRRKRLCSVDKANVLASGQLWREVVTAMAAEFPEVTLSHLYVDNAAMQLVLNPAQFDVIVTENTFGDILSDEASVLAGSLGMLPSASLGEAATSGRRPGLYEPCHGSAPDLKGQDKVNPIAQILSLAMMLESSFGYVEAATAVRQAVAQVLAEGYRTFDILEKGTQLVGTAELGKRIAQAVSICKAPLSV